MAVVLPRDNRLIFFSSRSCELKILVPVEFCLAIVLACVAPASAATLTVTAGGDLQAAIDAARPGDTIVLQAGATFNGPFRLRAKGGPRRSDPFVDR
jgi:hypothetical protein